MFEKGDAPNEENDVFCDTKYNLKVENKVIKS